MGTAKNLHLLRALSPPAAYAALIGEARRRGERIGWLEWHPEQPPEPCETGPCEEAAELGVLRAVSVRDGQLRAIKPMLGPPVLRDVVREHFRGCLAVLVSSHGNLKKEIPTVEAEGRQLIVRLAERAWTLAPEQLCDRLRRPAPFDA